MTLLIATDVTCPICNGQVTAATGHCFSCRGSKKRPVDPTPEEIKRLCLVIQRDWSDKEFCSRSGYDPSHDRWTAPVVSVSRH